MVDLENLDAVDNINDLLSAVKMLYDPELGISDIKTAEYKVRIKMVAKKLGITGAINELMRSYTKAFGNASAAISTSEDTSSATLDSEEQEILEACRSKCKIGNDGKIASTIDNYCIIMRNDPMFSTLCLNELTGCPEFFDPSTNIYYEWTDNQDSSAKQRIERICEVYHESKYYDAVNSLTNQNKYHPIKQILEPVKWDGVSRIPEFLIKWMGAEDNEYNREVSRLIFAGGIHRLYEPGCKFDDMAVLIGKQGTRKSTIIRWLALEDRFFGELTTIKDKEGGEAVGGKWIMEIAELLALTRTKEQEEVKAFLSRQDDRFRAAWDKRSKSRKRTCIFIGTSNREQFITDKTGGRRFYPVHCNGDDKFLGDHEEECKEYILQCWAEAREKKDTDFMQPYARRDLRPIIEEKQSGSMEDDYRIGMIQDYLDRFSGEYVCLKMIWDVVLDCERIPFSKADQSQLNLIMANNIQGWERVGRKYISGYGQQRAWRKKSDSETSALTYTTPNDWTPF